MLTISERDATALLEVAGELAHLDDPLPFPPRFMQLVAGLLRSDGANYCVLDRRNRRVVLESQWWDEKESLDVDPPVEDWLWGLLEGQPVCRWRAESRDWMTVRTVSDCVTQREFRSTPIWNELYRDAGINYWIDMGLLPQHGHTRTFISVHERHDFGDRERLLLALLAPQLEKRARNVETAAAALESLATVEEAGEEAQNVVLATARGTIEFASPHSRALLADYFGVKNGSLPEVLVREGVVVGRLSDSRLTVRIARIDGLAVLLLGEQDEHLERLTPRQREILAGVAAGLTDAQIGERLGIAASTVNKHLESVYERLDVHTRTAAAAFYHGNRLVE